MQSPMAASIEVPAVIQEVFLCVRMAYVGIFHDDFLCVRMTYVVIFHDDFLCLDHDATSMLSMIIVVELFGLSRGCRQFRVLGGLKAFLNLLRYPLDLI